MVGYASADVVDTAAAAASQLRHRRTGQLLPRCNAPCAPHSSAPAAHKLALDEHLPWSAGVGCQVGSAGLPSDPPRYGGAQQLRRPQTYWKDQLKHTCTRPVTHPATHPQPYGTHLRDGGPVRELLDALPHLGVGQHVARTILHTCATEDKNGNRDINQNLVARCAKHTPHLGQRGIRAAVCSQSSAWMLHDTTQHMHWLVHARVPRPQHTYSSSSHRTG